MKNKIILIMIVIFFNSCKENMQNNHFKQSFNKSMIYLSYYNYYSGEINENMKCDFYYSTLYLSKISGINSNYVLYDIPRYINENDWTSDSNLYMSWYKENEKKITDNISDSISQLCINKVKYGIYFGVDIHWP